MSEEHLETQELLFEVLENQLADNNPKQVKETLMRSLHDRPQQGRCFGTDGLLWHQKWKP